MKCRGFEGWGGLVAPARGLIVLARGLVVLVAVFGWSRCGFGLATSRFMKILGSGRCAGPGVRQFLYEVTLL